MKLKSKILKIDPLDNVLVALSDLQMGETIENDGFSICLNENISAKHKFAIKEIGIGDTIYMYGVVVGRAKQQIKRGEAITTQNVIHEIENILYHQKTIILVGIVRNQNYFQRRPFWVIIVIMEVLVLRIIGLLFHLYFVKIEI
jgi:hypothetical protein